VANEETMEDIKRDLSELNCDKMLIHPNSPKITTFIEEKIIAIRALRDKLEVSRGFTKAMVYRYIMLMYSPNSPIRNMMALDWFEQKFEACAYAGFELNKGKDGYYRFDQEVVDMIMGKNNVITDMIVAFVGYLSDEKWGYVVFLKESMLAFTRDAIGRKTTDYKSAADYKITVFSLNIIITKSLHQQITFGIYVYTDSFCFFTIKG